MPKVGKKKFSYTPKGRAAKGAPTAAAFKRSAKTAKKRKKKK